MTELQVCLAGAAFRLVPTTDAPSVTLHPDYLPFLNLSAPHGEGGRYEILRDADALPADPDPPTWLWDSFIWRLGRFADGSLRLDVRDLHRQAFHTVARLSADFSSGHLVTRRRPPQPAYTLNYPEGQLLLLNRLSFLQGGLVHSSAIEIDGKGYLFCGRSGAGKTTIARLWKKAGFTLLCDDRNIVRVIDGKAWACSTPWHGEDPEVHPINLPLGGVFHLNQAPDNRADPVPYAKAVPRLFATSLAPFYSREGAGRVLDAYAAALEQAPSFDLYFTPDARAVECCLRAIREGGSA